MRHLLSSILILLCIFNVSAQTKLLFKDSNIYERLNLNTQDSFLFIDFRNQYSINFIAIYWSKLQLYAQIDGRVEVIHRKSIDTIQIRHYQYREKESLDSSIFLIDGDSARVGSIYLTFVNRTLCLTNEYSSVWMTIKYSKQRKRRYLEKIYNISLCTFADSSYSCSYEVFLIAKEKKYHTKLNCMVKSWNSGTIIEKRFKLRLQDKNKQRS